MRRIRTRIQKRDKEKVPEVFPEVFPVVSSLESRSVDPEAEYSENSEAENVPVVQRKEEQREIFGHNLANIPISARETGSEETGSEETGAVQAKEDDDLAGLIPEEADTEDLLPRAQELYEQLVAGDEEAIATLQEYGLDLDSLQSLSQSEAIGQIQSALKTLENQVPA